MNLRRFRPGMRGIVLSGAAFAILVALLIAWLGHRYDLETDRIAAEGRLAEGEFLHRETGSCSGDRRSCDSDTIHVAYEVDGVTYRTSMVAGNGSGSEPIFKAERIRVPRLGEERPFQVLYLPSDPSRSRLRADMSKSDIAVFGTAGMFLLIGLVFGAMGLFVLPKRNRTDR